jgi:hypothetical protein
MPGQVGLYKVLGDYNSIIRAGPSLLEDAPHETLQDVGANQLHNDILSSTLK